MLDDEQIARCKNNTIHSRYEEFKRIVAPFDDNVNQLFQSLFARPHNLITTNPSFTFRDTSSNVKLLSMLV